MILNTNLLGFIMADAYFFTCILLFISRLVHRPEIGHWIGIFQILFAPLLVYLLFTAPGLHRPRLHHIQVG